MLGKPGEHEPRGNTPFDGTRDDRDAALDGEGLPHVLEFVDRGPLELVDADDVGKSPVLEEIDGAERVREPPGVGEHDRADGTAAEFVPHEPEALLARGTEQVE